MKTSKVSAWKSLGWVGRDGGHMIIVSALVFFDVRPSDLRSKTEIGDLSGLLLDNHERKA